MRALVCAAIFLVALPPAVAAQDTVLARNEWTTVTKSDFDAEIARIPAGQHFTFLSSAERVAKTVEGILVSKTLAAQARAAKLDELPAVKAEVAAAIDKVLARHAMERAEAELKHPDFSRRAEELYKAEPRKYAEKDRVHLRQILVDVKCRTHEAAKARLLEARAELMQGKPFADVAKTYSDDPTVEQNAGDLGALNVDGLSIDFAEALRTMKPGDLSEPVRTNFGYHLIKYESLKKGRQYKFSEVRDSVVAEVKEDWLKDQRKLNVERITADPKLKLNLDAIQALKTDINAPAPKPQPKRPG